MTKLTTDTPQTQSPTIPSRHDARRRAVRQLPPVGRRVLLLHARAVTQLVRLRHRQAGPCAPATAPLA